MSSCAILCCIDGIYPIDDDPNGNAQTKSPKAVVTPSTNSDCGGTDYDNDCHHGSSSINMKKATCTYEYTQAISISPSTSPTQKVNNKTIKKDTISSTSSSSLSSKEKNNECQKISPLASLTDNNNHDHPTNTETVSKVDFLPLFSDVVKDSTSNDNGKKEADGNSSTTLFNNLSWFSAFSFENQDKEGKKIDSSMTPPVIEASSSQSTSSFAEIICRDTMVSTSTITTNTKSMNTSFLDNSKYSDLSFDASWFNDNTKSPRSKCLSTTSAAKDIEENKPCKEQDLSLIENHAKLVDVCRNKKNDEAGVETNLHPAIPLVRVDKSMKRSNHDNYSSNSLTNSNDELGKEENIELKEGLMKDSDIEKAHLKVNSPLYDVNSNTRMQRTSQNQSCSPRHKEIDRSQLPPLSPSSSFSNQQQLQQKNPSNMKNNSEDMKNQKPPISPSLMVANRKIYLENDSRLKAPPQVIRVSLQDTFFLSDSPLKEHKRQQQDDFVTKVLTSKENLNCSNEDIDEIQQDTSVTRSTSSFEKRNHATSIQQEIRAEHDHDGDDENTDSLMIHTLSDEEQIDEEGNDSVIIGDNLIPSNVDIDFDDECYFNIEYTKFGAD